MRLWGQRADPFSILSPYQRLWEDLIEQVGRWANLGLSLRQMQAEIAEQQHTQVGLQVLNELVQTLRPAAEAPLSSVAPVVLLDAIWLTLFEDQGSCQADKLGRQRLTKQRDKVCVLVALGLYPQSGRWGILGYSVADDESQAAWEQLLTKLETRGVYRERGVELFIHDGGSGLTAALKLVYPHLPHQRCLFHKLRNRYHAIRLPVVLPRAEARTLKRELLDQAHAVLFAARRPQGPQRLLSALLGFAARTGGHALSPLGRVHRLLSRPCPFSQLAAPFPAHHFTLRARQPNAPSALSRCRRFSLDRWLTRCCCQSPSSTLLDLNFNRLRYATCQHFVEKYPTRPGLTLLGGRHAP